MRFHGCGLKRPILRTIVIYGLKCRSRYGCDTQPILSPNNTHLHTALDIDISRYEYVYRSAHVHVWICICIPWRGQTLHITAYDTMSRSDICSIAVEEQLVYLQHLALIPEWLISDGIEELKMSETHLLLIHS